MSKEGKLQEGSDRQLTLPITRCRPPMHTDQLTTVGVHRCCCAAIAHSMSLPQRDQTFRSH